MPNRYNEKYTQELLTEAVANSISIADVLRYLQIPLAGAAHAHISRKIKQFGIDTSHFLGQAHMRVGLPRGDSLRRKFWSHAPRAHDGRSRASCADTARERRAVR